MFCGGVGGKNVAKTELLAPELLNHPAILSAPRRRQLRREGTAR